MSDIAKWIDDQVKSTDVVLFMKGTPDFSRCAASPGGVVQILDYVGVPYEGVNVLERRRLRQGIKDYSELADHPAALRQGRVRRRLRHRHRDVPVGRAEAALCRKGRGPARRLTARGGRAIPAFGKARPPVPARRRDRAGKTRYWVGIPASAVVSIC